MQNFRFKCKKCSQEFLRRMEIEEFDKVQYSSIGHQCYSCGFPKMAVIRSKQTVDDGFKPGWQSNIRKNCSSYGEYKAQLKLMDLVEIGYDELPEEVEGKTKYWTPDLLKKLHDMGVGFSSRELDALDDGKIKDLY